MSYSFADQQTWVGRVAAMSSTDQTAYVPDWLNQGYQDFVNRCSLNVMALTEMALTAGTHTYDVNTLFGRSDIGEFAEVYVIGTGIVGRHYLDYIDREEWTWRMEGTIANGIPLAYNVQAQNMMRFWQPPDTGMSVGGNATILPAALTLGSQTFSAIPLQYQRAPSYFALEQAFLDDNRFDDADKAHQRYVGMADECRADTNRFGKRRPAPLRPGRGYRTGRLSTYWTRMARQD